MKLDDVVLAGSCSAAVYLAYRWFTAQSNIARAVYVNQASPSARPGLWGTAATARGNVGQQFPGDAQPSVPTGFTWNDEAGAYWKKDASGAVSYYA